MTDFRKKHPSIKFHENQSNGSRVVSRGRTDTTKVKVALSPVLAKHV